MRVGVVTFPGTLDDTDAQRAVRLAGCTPIALWHGDTTLPTLDAVILPGGFSYGDYLRCGAIARFAPVMSAVIDAAATGMPVLGICNGFQVLCEAHLLPGALVRNESQSFVCRDQPLRVENTSTAWTSAFHQDEDIVIPMKNGEGRFVAADDTIARLNGDGRVVFRYLGNPNGSLADIAGICDERGRIVGLMPHPEHAVEDGFGPDRSASASSIDGLRVFTSILQGVLS